MRTDVSEMPLDSLRSATITVYPKTETYVDVLMGLASNGFLLDNFVTAASHTAFDARVVMTWDGTGSFLTNQPKPGDILEVRENGSVLWIGFIDEVNNFNEERGNRTISVTARSRDGMGPWRSERFTGRRYEQGTLLNGVMEDVLRDAGLTQEEFIVPAGGAVVPHSNVQFAQITRWDALTLIGIATGWTPITNARGQVTFYNRAVDRVASQTLTNERTKRIQGGKGTPAIGTFRVKWIDRNLTEVVQGEQVLGSATITAGFWRGTQDQDIYWSDDRSARAKNTRMKVVQSINDSLLPIGTESYTQQDDFHGTVEIEVSIFVSALATASLAAVLALDVQPDKVVVFGFGASTGITVPVGRVIRGIAEASLLLIMMSIGTGQYEILGEPFDFVHAINKTDAYDSGAPSWLDAIQEIQLDLIYDEEMAQTVAIRELLFRIASANRWDTVIVDDPRVEVGDIIELSDTSRLFVEDYSRNLMRDSEAELVVRGFRS